MYTLLAMAGIAGLLVLLLIWGIRRLEAVPATGQDSGKRILNYLAWAALGAIVFGVVGFWAVWLVTSAAFPEDLLLWGIAAVVLGAPVGGVIGAIVGALIARKRLARRQTSE